MSVVTPTSFDGVAVNDATFKAWFPADGAAIGRTAEPIVLDTIGGFPRNEGSRQQSVSFFMGVAVKAPTEAAYVANLDTLKETFRVGRSGTLIVDWDGEDRQRSVVVTGFYPLAGPGVYQVAFLAADPRWRAATETEVVETVTADGQTWEVTNDGNATVEDAVIVFAPQQQKAAADAQLYRRFAIVANRVGEPLDDWPIDITNGGINHAALVTAVKSQSDGDDMRVLRNGIEIPRYIGEHANTDANSATTKVWCTPGFGAKASAELLSAITNLAPADGGDIEVKRGGTRGWPSSGAFVIEDTDEVIRYDGLADPDVDGYDGFKDIKRGQWGTSAASASAGDVLYRVQHKIELIYGWTGAPAPESRPELKPILNLASSTLTNLRHEWLKLWDDVYPSRPGQWSRLLQDRDSQAAYMYLPTGNPTGATWRYNYGAAEPDELPYNVITRRLPVGTDGTSGQIAFTYDIDATLQLRVLGTDAEGVEVLDKVIHGAAATSYSSTFTNVLRAVTLYARSQVVLSTPDFADRLLSNADGLYNPVAALNAAGDEAVFVTNDLDEMLDIRGAMVLLAFDGSTKQAVTLILWADNGSGTVTAFSLGISGDIKAGIATSLGAAVWVGGVWSGLLNADTWDTVRPAIIMPGDAGHLTVGMVGTAHSALYWFAQYAAPEGRYPFYAYRLLGDGTISPDARAELGETVAVTAVGVDFDSTGVPYFALTAEESVYQADHVLVNNTTGQELRFDLYIGPTDSLEVDCGRRSVRNLTTGEEGLIYGVKTDPAQAGFFSFAPGVNELQLDDAGVVEIDVTVTLRAAWE